MRQGGHIACGRAMETAYNVLIGKTEKKRLSGRQVYYNEPSGCVVCSRFNTYSCKHKNALFGPIQEWQSDHPHNFQLRQKVSAPCHYVYLSDMVYILNRLCKHCL
jgi:hypothetical protein